MCDFISKDLGDGGKRFDFYINATKKDNRKRGDIKKRILRMWAEDTGIKPMEAYVQYSCHYGPVSFRTVKRALEIIRHESREKTRLALEWERNEELKYRMISASIVIVMLGIASVAYWALFIK